MAKNPNMRVSQGYQKNQAKKVMADLDVPDIDIKKTKQTGITIIICAVILMVSLTLAFKVWGALIALIITAATAGYFIHDIGTKQKKIINAYKTLGMTKEEYITSFEKAEISETQKKMMIDLWDKVPEPEKVIQQKGRPQQVNQSKQNKKKKKYTKKKKK